MALMRVYMGVLSAIVLASGVALAATEQTFTYDLTAVTNLTNAYMISGVYLTHADVTVPTQEGKGHQYGHGELDTRVTPEGRMLIVVTYASDDPPSGVYVVLERCGNPSDISFVKIATVQDVSQFRATIRDRSVDDPTGTATVCGRKVK